MRPPSWLTRNRPDDADGGAPRRIGESDVVPPLLYAIGDIHGCYDLFSRLEDRLFADAAARGGTATIVVLGDVVDRGPGVARVIDRLLARPPAGVTRLCLSGNHEATMAEFLDRPRADHLWLSFGGIETLLSYGIDAGAWAATRPNARAMTYQIEAFMPPEHLNFVANRPCLLRFGKLVFVHAGIDRRRPLDRQQARDLMWMRPDIDGDPPGPQPGLIVVHGHTPLREVLISPTRINLDTGAYAGGPLSAARFVDGRFDGVLAETGAQ